MDEELNENELEERLYAMLHHVDETQGNMSTAAEAQTVTNTENAPRSTIQRYWRTSGNHQPQTPYQKINTPKDSTINKTNSNISKPKEEKSNSPTPPSVDLSLFQTPPQNLKKTIEILDHDIYKPVVLESSDEDEVIEVELPPKPTITIESSDEDEVCIITKPSSPHVNHEKQIPKTSSNGDRESTSPVPSVVSSVSDEFIRGDCIALNISSKHAASHDFDFSLHGSDLLGQSTPLKKKKKKKSKEDITSTPVSVSAPDTNSITDKCFVTPKSKAKHKKQKSKSYTISDKSIPSADVYDSDSNQSVIITKNNQDSYIVTEKSLPSADVYESDSNQSEIIKENVHPITNNKKDANSSNCSISPEEPSITLQGENLKDSSNITKPEDKIADSTIDLTGNVSYVKLDKTGICENIVMANVTGFKELSHYEDETIAMKGEPKLGSTKIPPILYDNLDFDNLKGKDKVCKRRRYSLTTLRAEMEKFYNESWGGEDFNHREIQKYMSRDKSLWVIDPKDRMPTLTKRKATCHYCNRPGHRDDMCRQKPPVCYMCGSTGHYEPRCPTKMCVNCGSPNYMYSTMCRNCSSWYRITCAECGQNGHPASHCPDLWRRYHNTIDINTPLEESRSYKRHNQLFCSGCTRRGHLVHTCRWTIPFSGLPLNSPYVSVYRPLYTSTNSENSENCNQSSKQNPKNQPQDSTISSITTADNRNKRQSKSPSNHENIKKKKLKPFSGAPVNLSFSENAENKNSVNTSNNRGPRKMSSSKEQAEESTKNNSDFNTQPLPDFIPISSANRDKKGQMIQDNEVSDTSDVVTVARIYITDDLSGKLKTTEGQEWLEKNSKTHNVTVKNSDVNLFLSISGRVADQEAFQKEMRNWVTKKSETDNQNSDHTLNNTNESVDNYFLHDIPKNRFNVLRKIAKALDSLKDDLGDPNALYKELTYLQNQHQQLLRERVISPERLSNNTTNIKGMLKKLNMVLLGQARLGDGPEHLNELYSLQDKLTKSRQKNITLELRKEIGQHYHSIFTAIERNDYVELLQKYHLDKRTKTAENRRNKKKIKQKQKLSNNASANYKQTNTIPPLQNNTNLDKSVKENADIAHMRRNQQSATKQKLNKLIHVHRMLVKARPEGSHQKKVRVVLVRKLHSHISSLSQREQMNSKTLKKMKTIESQAHMFLKNIKRLKSLVGAEL